jgi:hypothetical protein
LTRILLFSFSRPHRPTGSSAADSKACLLVFSSFTAFEKFWYPCL